jgi:hypothetical protein
MDQQRLAALEQRVSALETKVQPNEQAPSTGFFGLKMPFGGSRRKTRRSKKSRKSRR